MKFREGQRFAYKVGGRYQYQCKVISVNKFGSPNCTVTQVSSKTGEAYPAYERTLKKSSFTDGTRTIVDEDIRDKPLTKEEEYENLWI